MWDPATGGAFDGLEIGGANLNQGTESTLALLSTLQHARSVAESSCDDRAGSDASPVAARSTSQPTGRGW